MAHPLLERHRIQLLELGLHAASIESHTVEAPSGELADALLEAARDARGVAVWVVG